MAFPSVFPGDIDSYVSKTDGIDDVMAVDVNELQSAITAIEGSLGVGFILDIFEPEDNSVLTYDLGTATWIAELPYVVEHGIIGPKHTADSLTAGQVLIATAATVFGWSVGKLVFGAGGRVYTFPDTAGTVALLEVANSFTLINPLTTIAESWIGPSSTAGIYFKGGNIGIGMIPVYRLDVTHSQNGVSRISLLNADNGASAQALVQLKNDANNAYQMGIQSSGAAAPNQGYIQVNIGPLSIRALGANILTLETNGTVRATVGAAGGLTVVGAFGCNGAAAQTAYSLGAASTDLATVVALANKLRLMAIANGTGSA